MTEQVLARSTDKLWKAWQHARAMRRRFESRPLEDPIRQKWLREESLALAALEGEERRLLGGGSLRGD